MQGRRRRSIQCKCARIDHLPMVVRLENNRCFGRVNAIPHQYNSRSTAFVSNPPDSQRPRDHGQIPNPRDALNVRGLA